jgi:hypothetical protein
MAHFVTISSVLLAVTPRAPLNATADYLQPSFLPPGAPFPLATSDYRPIWSAFADLS